MPLNDTVIIFSNIISSFVYVTFCFITLHNNSKHCFSLKYSFETLSLAHSKNSFINYINVIFVYSDDNFDYRNSYLNGINYLILI